MKQISFKPYSQKELPVGFKYPDSYLKLSLDLEHINSIPYFSWWFSDAEKPLEEITNKVSEIEQKFPEIYKALNYLMDTHQKNIEQKERSKIGFKKK